MTSDPAGPTPHPAGLPPTNDPTARAWDLAVDRTPGIDAFCSSSVWSFAAGDSWPSLGAPRLVDLDGAWYGFRHHRAGRTRLVLGLDAAWGFASPVVGPAEPAAHLVASTLARGPFEAALLAGQQRGVPLTEALIGELSAHYDLYSGEQEHRLQAHLGGGFEAWWARRSSRFRQRLRQLERRAADAGVAIIAGPGDPSVIDRIVAVESRTWKGREGSGLTDPSFADFYRQVGARLADGGGTLLSLLARHHDRDVGYIVGGVRGTTYRGFQLGYTTEVADLGVGHLLQLHQIRRLVAVGVDLYDLGMDMAYKHRWADTMATTFTLIVRAREGGRRRRS